MKRIAMVSMLCTLALGAAAVAQQKGTVATQYDSSAENTDVLLTGSERFSWQRPDRVLGLLSIREGEHVADLGAGVGFFAGPISVSVGDRGMLYLVETDPRLLAILEQARAGWPYDNTRVIRGSEGDPGLPEGELDLVLAVNMWHRFGNRRAMREAIQGALKPGGRLAIIDWHRGDIPIAPPVERRLPHDELVAEMKAAGWTVTTDARILEYQYFVILTPPAR